MRELGLRLIATSSHKGTPLDQATLTGPLAIFIGSEGAGLPRESARANDRDRSHPALADRRIAERRRSREHRVIRSSPPKQFTTETRRHGVRPVFFMLLEHEITERNHRCRALSPPRTWRLGLLESAYEECFCHELALARIKLSTAG